MRYFKQVANFILPNGNNTEQVIYQACEDVDYDYETHTAELNARVTAKRMCNGVEPVVQVVLTEITLQEYTIVISQVVYADLGELTELEEELNE